MPEPREMIKFIEEVRLLSKEGLDDYLLDLPILQDNLLETGLHLKSNICFFIGENGSGKSTLLEAIALAAGFNAEGGSKNFNFSSRESHSNLWESLRLTRVRNPRDGFFLRAESFYNVASAIDDLSEAGPGRPIIESYGGLSLHKQSHGESFMSLVEHRFTGNSLLLLDEPEAALSPARQLQLLIHFKRLLNQDAQLIVATHSPILMAYPQASIYQFSPAGIHPIQYRETEHYQLTKLFLDDPDRMMHHLLSEDD